MKTTALEPPSINTKRQYDREALSAYLKRSQVKVDQFLDDWLPKKEEGLLYEAMRYSLFAGGKRLRPILCLAAFEAPTGATNGQLPLVAVEMRASLRQSVLSLASSIELIHTYSLVHDDLPAMDNDDLRRGLPTNHKRYGEGVAILVGDALLTAAFTLMAEQGRNTVSSERVMEAIFELSSAAGMNGMVLGQLIDLQSEEKKKLDLNQLETIHRNKTGALITASVRIGGILGEATDDQLKRLTEYGQKVGLAFQIADDLLDVLGDKTALGKSVGQDEIKDKWTYPRLMGIEKASEMAHQCVVAALAALEPFGAEADPLRWIACYTIDRRN